MVQRPPRHTPRTLIDFLANLRALGISENADVEGTMRDLVTQNMADRYIEEDVPNVHAHAVGLLRCSLLGLRNGAVDGVPLDREHIEILRYHAARFASPSSIHKRRDDWGMIADDLSFALQEGLEVYLAKDRRTLPRSFVRAFLHKRSCLDYRYLYYVMPEGEGEPETIHIFMLKVSLHT